jgi:DNA-binding SARP family transcriptional activator
MHANRLRGYSDAFCVLACEIVAFGFFLRASTLLGTVDFSHLGAWLHSTSPEVALTSMFRLLGLGISGWLLLSTLLYAAAALSGRRAAIAKSRLITLPVLRRVVDSLVVASVAASSIGSAAAVSGAAPAPRTTSVVRPAYPPSARSTSPARTAAVMAPSVPARVSSTAIGRHFPHPGRAHHELPQADIVEGRAEVPSVQNGFAGLAPGTKVVVVQPGDCLSVLAERHLGDWRLDSEIEALNYGRLQPDGRALVDDHWIYVGWVLVMPPNAVGTIVVGETAPHDPANQTDSLHASEVPPNGAVPHGDGRKVARETARPSHDPAKDADPAPAREQQDNLATPSHAQREPVTTKGVTSTTTTVPGSRTAAEVDVRDRAPTTPARAPGPDPSTVYPVTAPSAPTTPHEDQHRDASADRAEIHRQQPNGADAADLALAASIGALAGASIVWRLDRSRGQFGHWRQKGQTMPRNKMEVEGAERRARAIADTERARWVDQALRYLTGLVEELSLEGTVTLPSPALVRVGACGFEVLVSPPVRSSLGWFSPTEDGSTLLLDTEVTLEELEALASERWPAWPALVSLGETEGSELLLNLEYAGSVSVDGDERAVTAVLGRMVLELSSQPWSDEMLAGLYTVGDSSLKPIHAVQRIAKDKAFDLAEKLDVVSAAQQDLTRSVSISALRAVACEALPNVVVAFPDAPAGALQCLAEAAVPEGSGIALAAAGPYEGALWKLLLSGDGQGTLQGQLGDRPISFTFKTACDPEEVSLLGEALAAASAHAGSGRDSHPEDIEAATEKVPDVSGNGGYGQHSAHVGHLSIPELLPPQRGQVEICVLGPVDVVGADTSVLEPSRRTAVLALLAYMATHERPITADEIASALWPLDAAKDDVDGPQRKTVLNALSRARGVLGYSASGKARIAYTPQGYRLASDVTCDWIRFEKLLANARRQLPADAITTLRQALELVRGEPFAGALSSQFFEWVASEHVDMMFAGRAVDAAEDLGQMALEVDDLETVVWAVEKGLQLEPTREGLFRLWMHALGRQGRPAKVDDVYRRLKVVLRQRLHSLQEPLPETREVWRRYTTAELSGS